MLNKVSKVIARQTIFESDPIYISEPKLVKEGLGKDDTPIKEWEIEVNTYGSNSFRYNYVDKTVGYDCKFNRIELGGLKICVLEVGEEVQEVVIGVVKEEGKVEYIETGNSLEKPIEIECEKATIARSGITKLKIVGNAPELIVDSSDSVNTYTIKDPLMSADCEVFINDSKVSMGGLHSIKLNIIAGQPVKAELGITVQELEVDLNPLLDVPMDELTSNKNKIEEAISYKPNNLYRCLVGSDGYVVEGLVSKKICKFIAEARGFKKVEFTATIPVKLYNEYKENPTKEKLAEIDKYLKENPQENSYSFIPLYWHTPNLELLD